MIHKLNEKYSINDQVKFVTTSEDFIIMEINNDFAKARISLYGGQLLDFQPHNQFQPVFWNSKKAVFKTAKAIRGGVPICWPWFGDNKSIPELPAHGYARISQWKVCSVRKLADKTTEVILKMPCEAICEKYQELQTGFDVKLSIRIVIGEQLAIDLISKNTGKYPARISEALHSYFYVGDIEQVIIKGLDNTDYIDKILKNRVFRQGGTLSLKDTTDRIYIDTQHPVTLVDKKLNREIIITKQHSRATVIWNPWAQNAQNMADMSKNGWQSMLCIEVANAADNVILLPAGETHTMTMSIAVK